MQEMLQVGDIAPEFFSCEGQGLYVKPIPAVDSNKEPISIQDFDGKCLVLIFTGEPREKEQVNSKIEFLKQLSAFADKCKKAGAELVTAGMSERGMMQECLDKAEVTFRYVPQNHESPMIHDYKAYSGATQAFTYVIADGKIQQGWDQTHPKDFDENHFQEVLAFIAANNLA